MNRKNYDRYLKRSEQATESDFPVFQKIIPAMEGKRILDVGCGTGLLLEPWASKNQVIGADNNQASLALAKKRGLEVQWIELEKPLPFPDNHFDLVVCKDTLQFVFRAGFLLEEMARVCKKGGLLLLHVPNEFSLRDLFSYSLGRGLLKKRWYSDSTELDNPHVRFFTKKNLKRYLERDFALVSDDSYRWGFPLPLIRKKIGLLSRFSDRLFSPGITLLAKKK